MKSHSIYNRKRRGAGFTMVEILVVLGIFAMLLAMGLSFSFDSYRGYLFRAEYGNVAHIIAKARNRAVNNFDESQHGVHFEPTTYTLFVGNDFGTSDPDMHETFVRNTTIDISGATDIVFEQLSGSIDTCDATPCEIKFDYGLHSETIEINDIGGITW